MNRKTAKEEGCDAYMQGKSLSDNPYDPSTISHTLWKQEFIYAATDPDYEPFPEQRDIIYYICNAMANQGTFSERKLSALLNKAPNFVNSLLQNKALPSDTTMMDIAKLGDLPQWQALLDLQIWRSENENVKDTWEMLLEKLSTGIKTALLALVFIGAMSVNPAQAALTEHSLTSERQAYADYTLSHYYQ